MVPDADPLGGEHFRVDVPMPRFKPWTYEEQPLYIADVKLLRDGRVLDAIRGFLAAQGLAPGQ